MAGGGCKADLPRPREEEMKMIDEEVQTIMIQTYPELENKWMKNDIFFETEVPYNIYGMHGFVDLVGYSSGFLSPLNIYGFYPRIMSLKIMQRDIKTRLEFFPQYLLKAKGQDYSNDIMFTMVLLNTRDNINMVSENCQIFKTIIPDVIFKNDIITKNIPPDDERFAYKIKNFSLVLYDPLKFIQLKENEHIMNESDQTFSRLMSYCPIDVSSSDGYIIKKLAEFSPYKDQQDFLVKYKRYVSG